ncbi:unnamed protein product [Somion occarium]|uniref:Uncharacterized protein n=1 Tax=Somion occarium TaxID=3059160 RepID=A0ABP1DJL6_9APHY
MALDNTTSDVTLVPGTTPCTPAVQRMHSIAWRFVFEAALPPSGFLDPSLSYGSDCAWSRVLRFKKTLPLVCKSEAWQEAASELLYEDIVIRRPGELVALVRTVRSNARRASAIKKITFSFYVPKPWVDVVDGCMTYLLTTCRFIGSICFRGILWHVSSSPYFFSANKEALKVVFAHLTDNLTNLEYTPFHNVDDRAPDANILSLPLIGAFTNLVSFSLSLMCRFDERKIHPSVRSLSFERLETLWVHFNEDDAKNYLTMLASWHLPKLTRFGTRPPLGPASSINLTRDALPFFDAHGSKLKYLEYYGVINTYYRPYGPANPVIPQGKSTLLQWCPSLQHVVTGHDVLDDPEMQFIYTDQLRFHLDVWLTTDPAGPLPWGKEDAWDRIATDNRLSRPKIRILAKSLNSIRDLPLLLPPRGLAGVGELEGIRRYDFDGLRIVETKHCLLREDTEWFAIDHRLASKSVSSENATSVEELERGTEDEEEDEEEGEEEDEEEDDEDDEEEEHEDEDEDEEKEEEEEEAEEKEEKEGDEYNKNECSSGGSDGSWDPDGENDIKFRDPDVDKDDVEGVVRPATPNETYSFDEALDIFEETLEDD